MFDTMTFTKVVGGLCGAFLVFLLGKFVAEEMYAARVGHHGDEVVQGYLIDTGGDDAPAEEEEGPSFEEVYASADPGKGERVFNKCKACHKLEKGENSTGPYLYGVVGREVDTAEGFGYSGALEEVVDVWTPEHLSGFLENPAGYAPGTAMAFAGLKSVEDRANVIAYLDSVDD
ncbi:cytochrome c family protein [Pelagivirga sediminicola]|uniref:Cytochrome c family protein n=1 Tax=Pelagivirga sediminicola TaxID=2170575 RepID=A0A2T7G9R8_9RHOB|nr:cytochrome c family protein [Pelagivirga sediminicola]PVA11161.1 cytochrome c family protein [Pelagivirga sediminicola]